MLGTTSLARSRGVGSSLHAFCVQRVLDEAGCDNGNEGLHAGCRAQALMFGFEELANVFDGSVAFAGERLDDLFVAGWVAGAIAKYCHGTSLQGSWGSLLRRRDVNSGVE